MLGLRPEALHLSDDGAIGATVVIVELLGAETHVICQSETGARVIVRQGAAAAKPKIGEAVRIAVDPDPALVPPLRRRRAVPARGHGVTAVDRGAGRGRPERRFRDRPESAAARRRCAPAGARQALLAYL